MLQAITSVLGTAISANPLAAAASADIFEAYILTLVIRAARTEKATVGQGEALAF